MTRTVDLPADWKVKGLAKGSGTGADRRAGSAPRRTAVDPPVAGRSKVGHDPRAHRRTEEGADMPLVDDRTKQLIDVLADCIAKCEACAKDCASQGNADLADCISLCSDCAALCQACIPLLARTSQFSAATCATCADACERCANECDRTGMIECAEACRTAAQACRQMAGAAA